MTLRYLIAATLIILPVVAQEPKTIEELIAHFETLKPPSPNWTADMNQTMSMMGMNTKMTGRVSVSGERMRMDITMDMMGQQSKTLSVTGADGITWTDMNMMGMHQITKMDMNKMAELTKDRLGLQGPVGPDSSAMSMMNDPKKALDMLNEMYALELKGDDTFDGVPVYVFEGAMTEAIKAKTPPQAAQMGMDFDKVRCLWGKDGLIRKQEMLARDGTPSMMMEMTNYTFGVELDDALFSFTPPEGVPVQDMTLQYETALQSDEKLDPEKLKALEELVKNFVTSSADTSTDAETPQGKYKVGDTAPDFTGPGLKGDKVSLAQFRGKVTLLDFWATWCGPCVHELPNVIAAYKKYHDEGFDILSVSLDDERPALDKFLGEHADMKWAQIYEGKGWDSEIGKMFGVEAIPFTLLLDAEGKIIGADLRGEALDAAIAKALAK